MEHLQGEVTQIRGSKAQVRVQVRKACGDCAQCGRSEGYAYFEADTPPGVKAGDIVTIVEERVSGLPRAASALLFSLPFAALVAGIWLGLTVPGALGLLVKPDIASGLAGMGLFLVTFFLVAARYTRLTRRRQRIVTAPREGERIG